MTMNRFVPLYSTQPGAVPSSSVLNDGEIAINLADGKIYAKSGSSILVLNDTTNFISSSEQLILYGTATTGSNAFLGTQQITGSLIFSGGNVEITSSQKTGIYNATEIIDPVISAIKYTGAAIEYTAQRQNEIRSGIVIGSWSGSTITYTDVSNLDIGNTYDLSFNFVRVNDEIRFRAYSLGSGSGQWNVQFLFKLFPNLL